MRVERPAALPSDRQVVFNEVPAGTTPPVKTWFPIGQSIGHEFVYERGSRELGRR